MERNKELLDYKFRLKTYNNGQLAVFLQDYNGFPLAEISIKDENVNLNIDEFIFKDYSENSLLATELLNLNLITPSDRFVFVGKHLCPICKINT